MVGWGAIARTVAGLLDARIELVAVATRRGIATPGTGAPGAGARAITAPGELAATRPALVVEAAGRDAVRPWALAAFACGADAVVSSASALADPSVLAELVAAASAAGRRLEVQSGALGGIDALAAASLAGLDEVEHRIVKPPAAWRGTDAERLCDLDALAGPTEFFTGSAAVTAARFPMNANVAMTSALAGVGPDRTRVVLVADPRAGTNRHELVARGAFGTMRVELENRPLPDNPRSSMLAALALARRINGRVAPFVV